MSSISFQYVFTVVIDIPIVVVDLYCVRLGAFETWFADKQNHSALHDGWMLVASALASEFGVSVDSEQCKSKVRYMLPVRCAIRWDSYGFDHCLFALPIRQFRILRAQTQNRSGDQAATGDGNPGSAAKRPRLSNNGDTMSLASATATINLLLNSEQNAQALLQRAVGPAEARQPQQQQHQPQQQPMHVEEDGTVYRSVYLI